VALKMVDVTVGMCLRSTLGGGPRCDVLVTEITERGFIYDLCIEEESLSFIPRWGMSIKKRGHEHFGLNGDALFEEVKK
jgi:hypothetical protein